MINNSTIKSPIFTEKSLLLKENDKYTFEVDRKATKGQIKEIIEEIYKVNVEKIAFAYSRPKLKRSRVSRKRETFLTQAVKKAIVTLKKGDKIDIFEFPNN